MPIETLNPPAAPPSGAVPPPSDGSVGAAPRPSSDLPPVVTAKHTAPAHSSAHTPPPPAVTTLRRESGNSDGPLAGRLMLIAGLVGLAVTATATFRLLYVAQQNKTFASTISSLRQQYDPLRETESQANEIKVLADSLTDVYRSQVSYISLIKKLEETTYNGVRYRSISLDEQGQVVLTGTSSTYLDFAKAVKSFKEAGSQPALTSAVAINSAAQDSVQMVDGTVIRQTVFTISFALEQDLLLPAHEAPLLTAVTGSSEADAPVIEAPTESISPFTISPQAATLPEGTL